MESPHNASCHLVVPMNRDEEETFDIDSNDFFRPALKQIRNSVFEIKKHFMHNDDAVAILPTIFEGKLVQLKKQLLRLLEDEDLCLYHGDVLQSDTISEGPSKVCKSKGLVFLTDSIATLLNLKTSPRPALVVSDVLILFPNQPSVLVTLVDTDNESREMRIYNASLARGLTSSLQRFLDEGYKTLFGTLCVREVESSDAFNQALRRIVKDSSMVVTAESLSMNPSKYDKLLTALWASVAETKSVLYHQEDYLRFLTKEQCIILVDNINKKNVHVKSKPRTGATTLMLEVGQRAVRHNTTVLVCNTKEEKDAYEGLYRRNRCQVQVVTVEEMSQCNLKDCKYIVGVIATPPPNYDGYFWSFTPYNEEDTEKTFEEDESYCNPEEHPAVKIENSLLLEDQILQETEFTAQEIRKGEQTSNLVPLQEINVHLAKEQDRTPGSLCSMLSLVSERSSDMMTVVVEDQEVIRFINELNSGSLNLVLSWTIN